MARPYAIHDLATLAGVTPKALRHYDRLGLLRPQRTATGYRVYDEHHLVRLEQIVALKFLGLPLKQIRRVLDRDLPLSKALLGQRTVLEEKRQLLDRAIRAIQQVERVIVSGKRPDAAILKQLIEVIAMQSHAQSMKQYYSNAAWEKLTRLRRGSSPAQRSGVSKSWVKLLREAESILGEDPASPRAQKFCARWFALLQTTTGGDADILAGHRKAWADRANWPPEVQRLAGNLDAKAVGDFTRKACAAGMKKYYAGRAWTRKTSLDQPKTAQAWKALYADVRASLAEDPASKKGQALAKRWCQLSGVSTHGDRRIQAAMKRAWKDRQHWPLPLRQYVAQSNLPEIVNWIGKAIHHLRPIRENGEDPARRLRAGFAPASHKENSYSCRRIVIGSTCVARRAGI